MPEAGIIVTGARDVDLSTVEFEYIAQHEQDSTSGKLQAAFLYNRPRTPGPVRCTHRIDVTLVRKLVGEGIGGRVPPHSRSRQPADFPVHVGLPLAGRTAATRDHSEGLEYHVCPLTILCLR
jgi:hypothetical protein